MYVLDCICSSSISSAVKHKQYKWPPNLKRSIFLLIVHNIVSAFLHSKTDFAKKHSFLKLSACLILFQRYHFIPFSHETKNQSTCQISFLMKKKNVSMILKLLCSKCKADGKKNPAILHHVTFSYTVFKTF